VLDALDKTLSRPRCRSLLADSFFGGGDVIGGPVGICAGFDLKDPARAMRHERRRRLKLRHHITYDGGFAITVAKNLNVRACLLRGLSKSKSAQIPTWTPMTSPPPKKLSPAGSGTWVVKSVFYPQRIQHAEMLKGEPEMQAKALIKK